MGRRQVRVNPPAEVPRSCSYLRGLLALLVWELPFRSNQKIARLLVKMSLSWQTLTILLLPSAGPGGCALMEHVEQVPLPSWRGLQGGRHVWDSVTQSPSLPSPDPPLPPVECPGPSAELWKVLMVRRGPSDGRPVVCSTRLNARHPVSQLTG